MFELLDGRASAFQWDTGLYVDCTGLAESDEVHFCRPGITLALHPAMQGETLAAPVPDELLQQAQPIIVYAYAQTVTGEITRVATRLCVTARPKPPGYIASPTDALRWDHLQEQIENLQEQIGDLADPEAVQQIVEDYLAENPPTVTETDPTVPEWAKAAQKPSYTASEVGADPSGTAASQVSAHNTGTDTHSDIRLLISGLTDRLNALADSDDTTLDQLSEVVAYIKSNRELIAAITTDKVSVADIVNNLTTNVANKPLSAAQGVALKALIDAISIPDKLPNPNALTFTGAVSAEYDGSAPVSVEIPSGGRSGAYPVVDMTSATAELAPNTYYKWGEIAALSITLADPTDATITNEYCFEFTSGETAATLTVPSDIKWVQEPTIEAGKTYQVSILNGIGVICGA